MDSTLVGTYNVQFSTDMTLTQCMQSSLVRYVSTVDVFQLTCVE